MAAVPEADPMLVAADIAAVVRAAAVPAAAIAAEGAEEAAVELRALPVGGARSEFRAHALQCDLLMTMSTLPEPTGTGFPG